MSHIHVNTTITTAKTVIKMMHYSCGKITKRIYDKATMQLVDAIPVKPSSTHA